MNSKVRLAIAAIVLLLTSTLVAGSFPGSVHARELHTGATQERAPNYFQLNRELAPEETLFVANRSDSALCRDFSPLLKNLRVEWLILDDAEMPASAHDKHVLLIGSLDAEGTGPLIEQLLSPDELREVRDQRRGVFVKESPWQAGRTLLLAVGADRPAVKDAAEIAATTILEAAHSRAVWYTPAQAAPRDEMEAAIAKKQALPVSDELPLTELIAEPKAGQPRTITSVEAAADVSRLLRILADGWCGYGTFGREGAFPLAEEAILERLAAQPRWSPAELAALLREELDFIHDCHLKIGDVQYCAHLEFWYDETLNLWPAADGYHCQIDGVDYRLQTVNGEPPDNFLFPSLDEVGQPTYRLGRFSYEEPEALHVTVQRAADDQGSESEQIRLPLAHSEYYARETFGEERIGGIPVIRARSFADIYVDELAAFLETAQTYRGEPFLILDIRGNGGGNTQWPKSWVSRFTGHSPSMKQVLTELNSRTSMVGRANLFDEMLLSYPASEARWIEGERDQYLARAEAFDSGQTSPYWSPLQFPGVRFIPNETTLIVVVDEHVASAGEGLLSYLYRQVENVLVVGENSHGALTFGQISLHQLPNSKLKVYVPIKLNVMLDLACGEECGFPPDLWLPPDQALNRVVSAVRAGVLSSRISLPPGYFAGEFTPERVAGAAFLEQHPELLPLAAIMLVFVVMARLLRGQPHFFFFSGISWLAGGLLFIKRGHPVGYALIAMGAVFLAIWFYRRFRSRAEVAGEAGASGQTH